MLNSKNSPSPYNEETTLPSILSGLQSVNNYNNNKSINHFQDRTNHCMATWEINNQEHKIAKLEIVSISTYVYI